MRGQVNMANEVKLHSPLCSNLEALVLRCVVEHCCREELSPFRCQLQVLQFSVHLIGLLSMLLRHNSFTGIQTGNKPPKSDHDLFWVQVWLWEVLWSFSSFNHWACRCWLSYKIYFPSQGTTRLRNGLLLHRIREDDTLERWFFFFYHLMSHPRIELFHLPNLFQCWMTIEWSTLSFSETSHSFVRGSALIILSIGCCQLLMAGHCTPHIQGCSLLCKASWTTTALYACYCFQAKCIDTVSCLCCFIICFELE